MKKILIIGGDSFIAQQLYKTCKTEFEFFAYSRSLSIFEREDFKIDFKGLNLSAFDGCDAIINFAAIVHNPKASDTLYNEVNYLLAIELAKKAKKAGIPHFVQMSTIAVYGNAEHITGDTIINPENAYGKSKSLADHDIWELADKNFQVSIVRPPMIYGGNKCAPGNMQRLIKLSQKGLPLPFKNISNQRHFLHIGNLVECLRCILENTTKSEVYLPSDRKSYSTEDILNRISFITKKKVRCFKLPNIATLLLKELKPNIFERLYGNKTIYAQTELMQIGYKPLFTLSDGLKEMIDNN